MPTILAIETTAHTFGVAIVRDEGELVFLTNKKDAYTRADGGMIPAELSEHHMACFADVLAEAMQEAQVTIDDIDAIAYSRAPGIGHALRVGSGVARALALHHDKPLLGVNHCIAHLEIGRALSGHDDPVLLYASGANTQVIAREQGAYRVFGETLDLGVGNFIDTIAREMGLGFPGGPAIERLAASHEGELIELPYSVKGMDVSFSGMQTRIKQLREQGVPDEGLAHALQETAFAMLVEVTERAVAHTNKQSVVLGGGVACNQRLQDMTRLMCEDRGVAFFAPPKQYLVDNAAMIGVLGLRHLAAGRILTPEQADIDPHQHTEEAA